MAHEGGCEVLRNTCALTLGDEPLTGRVEHGAAELRMLPAQIGIALDDRVHVEVREQPT